MYSSKVSANTEINAPIQKVYNILTDPVRIPLIMPGLIENTNIPELPLKSGSSFHYKYQFYGIMFEGIWVVVRAESPSVYEATTDNPESRWLYNLSDQDSKTHISVTIEYTAPESVLSKIRVDTLQVMNQKEAELFLHNLKTLLEMQG